MATETIRPGVVIDGNVYYPSGWMYILAFALRECKWAIDAAETPEYKEQLRQYKLKLIDERKQETIAYFEARLAEFDRIRESIK